MSKSDKPLTVRRLKEIMNEIPEDMVTDALVLVYHEGGEREYSIVRTGQFSVVPNLTFTIARNVHGLYLSPTNNADDELRAEIDDYIDDIRYNNEVPFDERLDSAKKSIHHLVKSDRNKHELQARRETLDKLDSRINCELSSTNTEFSYSYFDHVLNEIKQELEESYE